MNILFHTTYQVAIHKGGTERVTTRTSEALRRKGHRCFSSYSIPISKEYQLTPFEDSLCVKNVEQLRDFLVHHQIEVVIIQGVLGISRMFVECKKDIGQKIKIISAYHFSPGAERYMISLYNKKKILKNNQFSLLSKIKAVLQIMTYPIYRYWKLKQFKQLYKYVYRNSDKVVLLSENFIPEYMEFGDLKDTTKFSVIPNSLSYDEYASNEEIRHKKKMVLIVSRMEEIQKRISLAIKIWSYIEADNRLKDWSLYVLGDGESLGEYRQQVRRTGLKRLFFEGIQEPRPYYQESSIFMMTSKYEGWGLTLTEAQQFGCVPIAFNTYSSLSDIITDKYDGYIIADDNIKEYVSRLAGLMLNNSQLIDMGIHSVESSKRYSLDRISYLWCNLIEK